MRRRFSGLGAEFVPEAPAKPADPARMRWELDEAKDRIKESEKSIERLKAVVEAASVPSTTKAWDRPESWQIAAAAFTIGVTIGKFWGGSK